MIGHEENETCGRDGCDGVMEPSKEPPSGCYCHASPPCELCVNDPFRCSKCDAAAGTEPDAPTEPATPTAPPDPIARQMGPEVTAWIADVLHQWSVAVAAQRHAEIEAAAEKATREYIANQLCEFGAERDSMRKRLTEVANHVDPSVLASVNAKLAQSRKALADTHTECEQWKLLAKNYENERDAATKRAQIAEGELTKTRQLHFDAERRAEIAEAALAGATSDFHKAKFELDATRARITGMETTLENALANPLSLFPKTPRLRVADMGQFGSGEAFVGVVVHGQNSHDATLNAIVALAKSIQP